MSSVFFSITMEVGRVVGSRVRLRVRIRVRVSCVYKKFVASCTALCI